LARHALFSCVAPTRASSGHGIRASGDRRYEPKHDIRPASRRRAPRRR
jgi:hypothetical protein